MNQKHKNYIILITLAVFGLFLNINTVLAAPAPFTIANPSCFVGGLPFASGVECSDSVTITISADQGVLVGSNSFDDWGTLTVTRPSGGSSSLTIGSPSSFGPASMAVNTNITNMFSEGAGDYTITVWAKDTGGAGLEARAEIIIVPRPSCSIYVNPSTLISGETINPVVSWKTTDAISATLDGVAVTPVASGNKAFTGVNSAVTYVFVATDSYGINATCSADILVIIPPVGGLVPCGRMADDPGTAWNEKESCGMCHAIPLVYNVINYLLSLAGIIAILMLALTMLISNFSFASANQISTIKTGLTKVLQGFVIVFVSWLVANVVMTIFGFVDPLGDGSWKIFTCNF